ncbi:hypothetical protein GCK32_016458, partial [Trichostrongylus colubriformis]
RFHDYNVLSFQAYLQSFRLSSWRFLEDPQSSVPAAVFAILSVIFVFGSVFGLILGSMPEFQVDPSNASAYHAMHAKTSELEKLHKFLPSVTKNEDFPDFVYRPTDNPNFALVLLEYVCIGWFTFEYIISNASAYHAMHAKTSELEKLHKFLPSVTKNEDFPDFVYRPTDNPNFALVLLEYVCIGWFTFEYIIRLIIYPKRGEFLRKTLNVIDMLTILPFYLELCLPVIGVESHFKEITGDFDKLPSKIACDL